MAYLLDTTFMVDSILGRKALAHKIIDHIEQNRLSISIITLAELYEGAFHRSHPQAVIDVIESRIRRYAVLPVTEEVCLRFAEVRADLRRRGHPHPEFDLLIAATALAHDLTLVTHNTKDFANIPELRLADL